MKSLKGGWEEIPILSGTINTLLKTITEINTNETLVLSNETDDQKRHQIDSVTAVDSGVSMALIDSGNDDEFWDITIDSTGNVFVYGWSNNDDHYIVKFDSDLNLAKQYTISIAGEGGN